MPTLQLDGYLALGIYTVAGGFVELNQNDYYRWPIHVNGDNTNSLHYSNVANSWGHISGLGIYKSQLGSDLVCYWPIANPWEIKAPDLIFIDSNIFHMEITAYLDILGAEVGTLTPVRNFPTTPIFSGGNALTQSISWPLSILDTTFILDLSPVA